MNELKNHVDYLFYKYKNSNQIQDFKLEILGNLEAKKADLMEQGMDETSAIKEAKNNIKSIDNLIDGNKCVDTNAFKLECQQTILLFVIIAWIFTIPLILINGISIINITLFIIVAYVGISFFNKNFKSQKSKKIEYISIDRYIKLKKTAWIIWVIFIVIFIFSISAITFASNIWFSRPIRIEGPYEFAILVSKYYIPLLSILIPITISRFPKIVLNNEVGECNEN